MSNSVNYPHFNNENVQLSKYISLKLEKKRTNIYLDHQLFRQCKSLIFHIPKKELERYDEYNSIDVLEQEQSQLKKFIENGSLRNTTSRILPRVEFWGHCSNLQAWIENNYDTKILHHSLAFPLLRELCRLGDVKARRIFKNEIISRFFEGSNQVKCFLLKEGFLKDFNSEERGLINEGLNSLYTTSYFAKTYFSEEEIPLLFDKQESDSLQGFIHSKEFSKSFTRKYDYLKPIYNITGIEGLSGRTDITRLSLIQNYITEIDGLDNFSYLRELALNINEIKDIKNLSHLTYLRGLSLSGNQISEIKGLENLVSLEFLDLSFNQITKIEGLECLRNLKSLNLWNNKIKVIKGIENLTDLRILGLGTNKISVIQGLEHLRNLRVLRLNSNRISEIKDIEHLTHLKRLSFYNNKISEILKTPNLPHLQEVNLRKNPINIKNFKNIQKNFGLKTNVFF